MALGPSSPTQEGSLVLLATARSQLWVRGSCSAPARILHGAWDRRVLGGRAPEPALLLSSQQIFSARCGYQLIGRMLEVSFLTLTEFVLIGDMCVCVFGFFFSFLLHLLLQHGGNGCTVKMKYVYSLLWEL